MNESGTRAEQIGPALKAAGWGFVEGNRRRRNESLYPQKLAALDALEKSRLHQAFSGQLSADVKQAHRNGRRDACGV